MADDHGSAIDQLGPHLLGRKPNPPDRRDFKLEDYLDADRELRRKAAAEGAAFTPDMTLGELGSSGALDRWAEVYAFWRWFKEEILGHPKPKPDPQPQPTPAPPDAVPVIWTPGLISDQARTSHCVGFTGLDFGNTLPYNDQWPNEKGHDLYYLCEPQDKTVPIAEQGGSTSRAICKVLQGIGRIGAYAFTQSAVTVRDYVVAHGPVGTGVMWDDPMFQPDQDGFIWPDPKQEAGGHELLVIGYSPVGFGNTKAASLVLQNHWTKSWGVGGCAYITVTEFDKLLKRDGDAWAALENPLAAAVAKAARG